MKNFVFALKQLPILKFCDSMIVIKYTGRYILTKNKLQKTAVSSGTELIKLRFRQSILGFIQIDFSCFNREKRLFVYSFFANGVE